MSISTQKRVQDAKKGMGILLVLFMGVSLSLVPAQEKKGQNYKDLVEEMYHFHIRAVQKLLGHKSIKTTEIYSHLSEGHLHYVIQQLPGSNLGTPYVLPGQKIAQVVEEFPNRL
jgi:hypothetical protein